MTATRTAAISYRKTKTGEWVAFGPADAIVEGCTCVVTKRDGTTKTELVERVGRIFQVDGRDMVYGYLAPKAVRGHSGGRRGGRWECDECGEYVTPGTRCWETGLIH